MADALDAFHPLVAGWFREKFGTPTEPQLAGWPRIASGRDVLIAAPTGSGKTLAAFLACLDDLVRRGLADELGPGTAILYISPLKALSNDVHRNLEAPLAELTAYAAARGVRFPDIRLAVRTGDTPASERAKLAKKPPHILVTTPESLFILLTSQSGRAALGGVRTVIVDEIHAVAGDKRGAHLAISLERLDRLVVQTRGTAPVRVGLSATQKPIERIARLLVGTRRPLPHIADTGHRRALDLAIEITDDELGAVASNEQFGRVYDRIAELVTQHRSTIVFVNTRRLVERAAAALEQRLGEEHVVAHHGSMSRALRLSAEQKLKHGQVKCAVATASLELGIDVGAVDLVVQLGSPRAIATLLQRVGRSGHTLGGTPKGRLIALTRDQLVECAALVRGVGRGNLDEIALRDAPLDILAQQIVAAAAAEEIPEAELAVMIRGATPYAELSDAHLEQILTMVSEGVSDRRGRTGAHVHRDRVGGLLRGRRGARLAAITSGGAIPDNNNYTVVQWPEEIQVGTIDEDFAIESSAGDIFQLGNTAWRIRRVEAGRVLVEDARGLPPTIPFWFGEAPARTRELSDEVSALRGEIDRRLARGDDFALVAGWLAGEARMMLRAAEQLVAYLAAGRAALGALPRKDLVIAERFFDEGGGMQLVLHAPFGGRVNRAWGLALRKKFCRTFDFELQAAATDDGIVISLGQPHSFALETVFGFVSSHQAEDTLVQALLDRPMFEIRWRWNVTRSLAVLRRRAGKKVPPHLIKMRAADTLSVVFPQAQACPENLPGSMPGMPGDREIPDHPLVFETIRDCLVEAMDLTGFRELLERLERGEIQILARDTVEPSPLSHELIDANPYAYLDDAPLEERRTRAVSLRRGLPVPAGEDASIGVLDAGAIALAVDEVSPVVRSADELHDALLGLWLVPESMGLALAPEAGDWFAALASTGRACRVQWAPATATRVAAIAPTDATTGASALGRCCAWAATDRIGAIRAVLGEQVACEPAIPTPTWAARPEREVAIVKIASAHLDHRGPVSTRALADELGLPIADVVTALLALEADGGIMRGSFTPAASRDRSPPPRTDQVSAKASVGASGHAPGTTTMRAALAAADDSSALSDLEWCNRRVLARIHRLTLAKLRKEIEPVSAAALQRFLLRWQRVARNTQLIGPDGLARVLEQLQGFETASGAWERELLPARICNYDPSWLDQMCLAGQVVWCRLSPRKPTTADDDATDSVGANDSSADDRSDAGGIDRSDARAIDRSGAGSNGRTTERSTGRSTDRSIERSLERSGGRASKSAHRDAGRASTRLVAPLRDVFGEHYDLAEAGAEAARLLGASREQIAAAAERAIAGRVPARAVQVITSLVTATAMLRNSRGELCDLVPEPAFARGSLPDLRLDAPDSIPNTTSPDDEALSLISGTVSPAAPFLDSSDLPSTGNSGSSDHPSTGDSACSDRSTAATPSISLPADRTANLISGNVSGAAACDGRSIDQTSTGNSVSSDHPSTGDSAATLSVSLPLHQADRASLISGNVSGDRPAVLISGNVSSAAPSTEASPIEACNASPPETRVEPWNREEDEAEIARAFAALDEDDADRAAWLAAEPDRRRWMRNRPRPVALQSSLRLPAGPAPMRATRPASSIAAAAPEGRNVATAARQLATAHEPTDAPQRSTDATAPGQTAHPIDAAARRSANSTAHVDATAYESTDALQRSTNATARSQTAHPIDAATAYAMIDGAARPDARTVPRQPGAARAGRSAPSRSAPLALMLRRDVVWLRAAAAITPSESAPLGRAAALVRDHLGRAGASFLSDLVAAIDLPPDEIEDALWELVGAGLATADGFASLRVLVDRKRGEVKSHFDRRATSRDRRDRATSRDTRVAGPAPAIRSWQDAIRKARTHDRTRPGHALRALPTAAGRWSLLPAVAADALDAEASARQLLHRYGVVFRDLITRESCLPPWRDLLVALRRLEARGEIRGGRFVTGFVGEQFALPEALDELRAARHPANHPEVCRVAATDPLNLVGILSPGPRVPAIVGNAVLYLDGHAVASLEAGAVNQRAPIPPGARIDDDLAYHPPPRPVHTAAQAALPL